MRRDISDILQQGTNCAYSLLTPSAYGGIGEFMKTTSRILKMALPAIALALLSACSSGKDDSEEAAAPAAETAATPAAAPAAAVTFASLTGDAAKGQKVFAQCMACHSIKDGENRVGPSLHGIIGRTSGQVAGFSYSAANKASGIVWAKEKLYDYLEAPQKMIPGTKMTFAGLKAAQDRADVIAYLDAND
jgi:cytochrome c